MDDRQKNGDSALTPSPVDTPLCSALPIAGGVYVSNGSIPRLEDGCNGGGCNPRAGNTGVHFTDLLQTTPKTAVVLDWLSFTIPVDAVKLYWGAWTADGKGARAVGSVDVVELLRALGIPVTAVTSLGYGGNGYTHGATFDGLPGSRVRWGGRAQRGTVSVELSGDCLAHYERIGVNWVEFVRYAVEAAGCRFTRVDVAVDDYGGRVSLSRVLEAAHGGGAVARYHNTTTPHYEGPSDMSDGGAWSVYFGRRVGGGESHVNIYNKAAESGVDDIEWVRVEARFHGDKAAQTARAIAAADGEGVGGLLVGLVRGCVDFRAPVDGDSNKTRWPVCEWWGEIVGGYEAVHVGRVVDGEVDTLEDKERWLVDGGAAAWLAVINDVYGEAAVSAIIAAGRERLNDKHLAMMAETATATETATGGAVDVAGGCPSDVVSTETERARASESLRAVHALSVETGLTRGQLADYVNKRKRETREQRVERGEFTGSKWESLRAEVRQNLLDNPGPEKTKRR